MSLILSLIQIFLSLIVPHFHDFCPSFLICQLGISDFWLEAPNTQLQINQIWFLNFLNPKIWYKKFLRDLISYFLTLYVRLGCCLCQCLKRGSKVSASIFIVEAATLDMVLSAIQLATPRDWSLSFCLTLCHASWHSRVNPLCLNGQWKEASGVTQTERLQR